MIVRNFPDQNRSDFNLDAPCPEFGWPNMIMHARAASISFPEHTGPLSIKCAFDGEEVYRVDGRRLAINDSNYLILNDGQRYSSYIESKDPVETFCVFFRPGFALEVSASLQLPATNLLDDPTCDTAYHSPRFIDKTYLHDTILSPLLFTIRRSIQQDGVSEGWVEEQFHNLMEALLRLHHQISGEISRLPGIRRSTREEIYRRLNDARDYIESDLGGDISLAGMASAACLSPHHFLRLFKHAFGETPHQYLTRRRLEKAQSLLLETKQTITQICNAIGFESLGSFSWLFRRRLGVSPEQFRAINTNRSSK